MLYKKIIIKIIFTIITLVLTCVNYASICVKNEKDVNLSINQYFCKPILKTKELTNLPDMYKYPPGLIRKKAFLRIIIPIIEKCNCKIIQDRYWLLSKRYDKIWNITDKQRLNQICINYNIQYNSTTNLDWDKLLNRVDIIPIHLVVIQAAIESGWGTSNLAKKNNNLFGMKCNRNYKYDCHNKNIINGYTVYSSIEASIDAYLKNLNTNNAYQLLRNSRAYQRRFKNSLNTSILINNLKNYSQLGKKYNYYLQQIFLSNKELITQIQNDVLQ